MGTGGIERLRGSASRPGPSLGVVHVCERERGREMSEQPEWLEPGEQIVESCGRGLYLKSKINSQWGAVVLTDRRLVFANRGGKLMMFFGAIGGIIQSLRTSIPNTVEVSVPREQIASAERGRQGVNKNILEVTTTGGDTYRFGVKPVEDFLSVLSSA